jgi:cytochrome c6
MKLRFQESGHCKVARCLVLACNLCTLILIASIGSSLAANKNEQASVGVENYKKNCVLCHGSDGSGQTPLGKDLEVGDLRSTNVRRMSDAQLRRLVLDGRGKMPGYSSQLNNEEIDQVIKYVRGLANVSKK